MLGVVCLGLWGCASPMVPGAPTVGRVSLGLPAGDWVDLGGGQEWLPAAGQGEPAIALQSRAVGLRGSQGEVQAVVLVLANVNNNAAQVTQWGQACAQEAGVRVDDAARGSPERVDCLRLKRRAEASDWLATREPNVDAWLKAHQIPLPYEATWVSHQFANKAGMYVATHVLADARLLEPQTRSSNEFLQAGWPAVKWSRELAQAVRTSTGMIDGRLNIPPFPLPQPEGPGGVPVEDGDIPDSTQAETTRPLPPLRQPAREAEPERAPRPVLQDRG
ncbi:hypothetical protein CCO03_02595 [Comamonas serinivorans]|uniref:Uncharacterized protein n=1 Tax=Comamonas serinivorans TaxID=1082851 RepID=A0A1Y0EJT1_9BURK|nr:hypothetical protein CCO03_02595 [Comamonas serinivorans]